jgi:hypothetical protein
VRGLKFIVHHGGFHVDLCLDMYGDSVSLVTRVKTVTDCMGHIRVKKLILVHFLQESLVFFFKKSRTSLRVHKSPPLVPIVTW